jgi:hypothetical protein
MKSVKENGMKSVGDTLRRSIRTASVGAGLLLALSAGMPVAAGADTGAACARTGQETVVTDKERYFNREAVAITGAGYMPDCSVLVEVVRPDGSVVRGDGSEMPGGDSVTTGSDGSLAHQYQLGTMDGTYTVNVIGADNQLLATTSFEDSADVQELRRGSAAGPLNRAFTAGETVYAKGIVDANKHYRWRVLDGNNSVKHTTTCVASGGSTTTVTNTYVIGAADPVSTDNSHSWKYELQQFNTSSACSAGSPVDSFDRMDFRVAKATAYGPSSLSTPKAFFKGGDSVRVVAEGVFPGQALRVHWIRPSGAVACSQQNSSSSWPTSNSNGRLPSSSTSYLLYPPSSSDSASYNRPTAYSSACPALTSSDQGLWRMRVEFVGRSGIDAEVVDLAAFTVDATAPATTDDVPADWVNHDVVVTLTATDAGSGVDKTYYTVGASPADPTTASAVYDPASKPTLGDGERIKYFSTDRAGNAEAVKTSAAAKVDKLAPSSSASSPATTNAPGTTIEVQYVASDSAPSSGIAKVDLYAKKNDGAWALVATDSAPDATGSFQYEHSGDGTYSFYTIATDNAGNVEATPTNPDDETIVVADSETLRDTVAPAPNLSGPPALTNDNTPAISGSAGQQQADASHSADAGEVTVQVFAGTTLEQTHTNVAVQPDGSFSVDAGQLADGTYTARVEQSDAAGNTGSAERQFTVDAIAPAAPTVAGPEDNSFNNTGNVTVSGTAEPASTVDVYDGTTKVGSATADGEGNWSAALTGVGDGSHTYKATATDAAGNTSGDSNSRTVVVDTVDPTSQATSPSSASTTTFDVTYDASDGGSGLEEVVLFAKGPTDSEYLPAAIDSAPGASGGSFSYTAGQGDGTYSFYTIAHDKAGNEEDAPGAADLTTTVTTAALWEWNGFFRPVDGTNNPLVYNTVRAGQSIPMKFSLGGDRGMNIFAAGYPQSSSISCTSSGAVYEPIESVATGSNSGLTYDAAADQYNYVWKTDSRWAGTCRRFALKLSDGSTLVHWANFKFTR